MKIHFYCVLELISLRERDPTRGNVKMLCHCENMKEDQKYLKAQKKLWPRKSTSLTSNWTKYICIKFCFSLNRNPLLVYLLKFLKYFSSQLAKIYDRTQKQTFRLKTRRFLSFNEGSTAAVARTLLLFLKSAVRSAKFTNPFDKCKQKNFSDKIRLVVCLRNNLSSSCH